MRFFPLMSCISAVAAALALAPVLASADSSRPENVATPLPGEFFREIPLENEAALIQEASQRAVELARQSRQDGITRRDAHAKHHGCIKGSFTVNSSLPEEARYGVFKPGARYPVWARFSNAVPRPVSDRIPDVRGMALKLMGVEGPRFAADDIETRTQDFLMVSHPVFIVRNLVEYNALLKNPAGFLLTHPRAAFITAQSLAKMVQDPLVFRYWSMTASKLGPRAVKYRAVSCEGQKAGRGEGNDFLRDAMEKHLSDREGCFDFQVQFQANEKESPIEDPTVEWKENVSPFVSVARINFPVQTFSSPAQNQFCEDLSFTPWHSLTEQRPLGNLNRARKGVYEAVSKARHDDNGALRQEPDGSETF
jgi:hypothetical protein